MLKTTDSTGSKATTRNMASQVNELKAGVEDEDNRFCGLGYIQLLYGHRPSCH